MKKRKRNFLKKLDTFQKLLKEKPNYKLRIKNCDLIKKSTDKKLSSYLLRIRSVNKKKIFFEKIKNENEKKTKKKKLQFFSIRSIMKIPKKNQIKKILITKTNQSKSLKCLKV